MQATRQTRTPLGGRTRLGQFAALLILLSAIIGGVISISGRAAESTTLISIGESNDDAQREELMDYFGNPKDAQVEIITIEDTLAAMQEIIPGFSIGSANSSAALTCLPLGDGLDVQTTNISEITPAIYAIALVTAGVGDATLIVAAPANAQAGGMTALTGIFSAWDKVKCESSQSTPERQELALREIALTAEIAAATGQLLSGPAGFFVVEIQRNIVVGGFTSRDDIAAVVANQEAIFGFTVPEPVRTKLVDFMVDLTKQEIDWSTFSKGWEIPDSTGNRIVMKGDGAAIIDAQATATARAARKQTQTAEAEKELTATARAEKRLTQTAIAELEAANLTATALAQPTATATATPLPSDESGELAKPVAGTTLTVMNAGGVEVDYQIAPSVVVSRDGVASLTTDLKKGDALALKVDAMTNQVVSIVATAPPSEGAPLAKLLYILPLLLLIPLGMVLKGRSYGDPFIVKRVVRD